MNADTHCPHAGADGGGVCVADVKDMVPTADKFCADYFMTCTGANQKYMDMDSCKSE